VYSRVVHADAALHRRRIVGVGQVARLSALDHAHAVGVLEVASIMAGWRVRLLAALLPQVGLAHIVVVGNGDRRTIAQDGAEVATEPQPGLVVTVVVVDLVAGEEQ
jgi:hypothetical protein